MKHRYREVGGRVIVRKFSENLNSDIETVDFGGGGEISERKERVRLKKGRSKDKEKGSSFLQVNENVGIDVHVAAEVMGEDGVTFVKEDNKGVAVKKKKGSESQVGLFSVQSGTGYKEKIVRM
ncbi:hypothetical protein V6N11_077051 [Hibiscus sabdariffa]|uniref:Uncharacterized protein n=1 Tax=Hibiscus sabdariffa TaxID=183260 RepID=A0ABR2TCJ6_9ROSI